MKCGARVQASVRSTAVEGVMAAKVLPDSPDAFKDASWEDVLPYYEALATRPLDTGNVEEWLTDCSGPRSRLARTSSGYGCRQDSSSWAMCAQGSKR
jgi:hypothetical protein